MDLALTDEPARYIALQTAQWFYEATETAPVSPEALIHTASELENYLTNGATTVIICKNLPEGVVR